MKRSELSVGQEVALMYSGNSACERAFVIDTAPWIRARSWNGKDRRGTTGNGVAVAIARRSYGSDGPFVWYPKVVQLSQLRASYSAEQTRIATERAAQVARDDQRAQHRADSDRRRALLSEQLDRAGLGHVSRYGSPGQVTLTIAQLEQLCERARI